MCSKKRWLNSAQQSFAITESHKPKVSLAWTEPTPSVKENKEENVASTLHILQDRKTDL